MGFECVAILTLLITTFLLMFNETSSKPWSENKIEVAHPDFFNTNGAHKIHFENNFGHSKASNFSKITTNNATLPYTNQRSKNKAASLNETQAINEETDSKHINELLLRNRTKINIYHNKVNSRNETISLRNQADLHHVSRNEFLIPPLNDIIVPLNSITNPDSLNAQFSPVAVDKNKREKRNIINLPDSKKKMRVHLHDGRVYQFPYRIRHDEFYKHINYKPSEYLVANPYNVPVGNNNIQKPSIKQNENQKSFDKVGVKSDRSDKELNDTILVEIKSDADHLNTMSQIKNKEHTIKEVPELIFIKKIKFVLKKYVNQDGETVEYLEHIPGQFKKAKSKQKEGKHTNIININVLKRFIKKFNQKKLFFNIRNKIYIYDDKILVIPKKGDFSLIFAAEIKEKKHKKWYNDALKSCVDQLEDAKDPFQETCCVNYTNQNIILTFFPWLINVEDRDLAFNNCLYEH